MNSFMHTLFSDMPILLRMSTQGAVLIALVLAVQWLCRGRLLPRWRYALWLLVLLRLALPWTIPSPISVFGALRLPEAGPGTLTGMAPTETSDAPDSKGTDGSLPVSSSRLPWVAWLWATGATCLAGYAVINHYRIFRRVTRQRPVVDESTLNLLEDCKALMGICVPVTLIETEAIASPTLFGFVRPRLLLPARLRSALTPEELRHAFLHELAHIKRHDVLTGWLMLALQTVHWFNPLVWVAFRRLRADRELACDALALSCANPGENRAYGMTIVKLLEGFAESVWAPAWPEFWRTNN